jgi:integrase
MEAAHKTSLAKGEVGIRDRTPAATIRQFAKNDFLPFCHSTFAGKRNTLSYYENGTASLLEFTLLADESLDTITADKITAYARRRQEAGMKIATVNRELMVLRRMFILAAEWGKVERALPRVRMIPGEARRDQVITNDEEKAYLSATQAIGTTTLEAYQRALGGIRALMRKEQPIPPEDPFRVRDAATLLIDCGLRPEECLRLRWEHIRGSALHIPFGKTASARRTIPLTARAEALIQMRRTAARSEVWVFPAPTSSGHIEKSTLRKQHANACKLAKLAPFPIYTFRHTCLTRWAAFMDPYTLAYLAGHSDFSTTRRYVHPQEHTVREAMERAREAQGRHNSGHTDETAPCAENQSAAIC